MQKALGEYLERERASFPRFYFVGDEDLLEIIGNSKNVARLQKHFKKMFAGIASVTLEEGQDGKGGKIVGMTSREGEEVRQILHARMFHLISIRGVSLVLKVLFEEPVSLANNPRINEWLTAVETSMKSTLVKHLNGAVAEVKKKKLYFFLFFSKVFI